MANYKRKDITWLSSDRLHAWFWTQSLMIAMRFISKIRLLKCIEDIYSFSLNTITITIECNENISIFTCAKYVWKLECFHYRRWKYLLYALKIVHFHFIIYTSVSVSEDITNVTVQNMNVMEHWWDKNKKFWQIKISWYQNVPYILIKKIHTNTC